MQDNFEELRRQIHELRTLCAPFVLQLTDLQKQMAEMRASLRRVESTSSTNLFTIGDLDRQSLDLLERVARIEQALKISAEPGRTSPAPAREVAESANGLPHR